MSTTTVVDIKRGDLLPAFEVTISYADTALDITSLIGLSTPVVLLVRSATDPTATPIVDRLAAEVTAVGTKEVTVTRSWISGETDTAGTYHCEIEFDIAGLAYTAPTVGAIRLTIHPDIG